MKTRLVLLFTFVPLLLGAQEHFLGINTSRKTNLLNADNNPAELTNLANKVDVSLFHISVFAANNKINMTDFLDSEKSFEDYEQDLLAGDDPFSTTINLRAIGPGAAVRINNWGFGIKSSLNTHISLTDVDPRLIDIIEEEIPQITDLQTNENQRITAIGYETIDFSVARNIIETDNAKLSAGLTLKLLSAQAYANGSVDGLRATLEKDPNDNLILRDAYARVDIAYAGFLADDFEDFNYGFFSGGINGIGADIGVNYLLKNENPKYPYKLNLGLSIRNIGSMNVDDNANRETYELNIPSTEDFDTSPFEDAEGAEEIIQIIENSSYFSSTSSNEDVKVNLPTSLNIYADYQLFYNFFTSIQLRQSLVDNANNTVIPNYSSYAIIPRYSGKAFEAYVPLSLSSISDFSAGLGFRFGGFFYLGSSSALSALATDQLKQVDVQLGFRFGIGSTRP